MCSRGPTSVIASGGSFDVRSVGGPPLAASTATGRVAGADGSAATHMVGFQSMELRQPDHRGFLTRPGMWIDLRRDRQRLRRTNLKVTGRRCSRWLTRAATLAWRRARDRDGWVIGVAPWIRMPCRVCSSRCPTSRCDLGRFMAIRGVGGRVFPSWTPPDWADGSQQRDGDCPRRRRRRTGLGVSVLGPERGSNWSTQSRGRRR